MREVQSGTRVDARRARSSQWRRCTRRFASVFAWASLHQIVRVDNVPVQRIDGRVLRAPEEARPVVRRDAIRGRWHAVCGELHGARQGAAEQRGGEEVVLMRSGTTISQMIRTAS